MSQTTLKQVPSVNLTNIFAEDVLEPKTISDDTQRWRVVASQDCSPCASAVVQVCTSFWCYSGNSGDGNRRLLEEEIGQDSAEKSSMLEILIFQ